MRVITKCTVMVHTIVTGGSQTCIYPPMMLCRKDKPHQLHNPQCPKGKKQAHLSGKAQLFLILKI